jgi:hypothetical protein
MLPIQRTKLTTSPHLIVILVIGLREVMVTLAGYPQDIQRLRGDAA